MSKLIFVLLINLPNGQQVESYRVTMPAQECHELMVATWKLPSPKVVWDGVKVNSIDAACLWTKG